MDIDKIRSTRKNLGYSQEYMADRLGLSQKAYSDIESGKTKLKSEVLFQLAKILETSPDLLCPISCSCTFEIEVKHRALLAYLDSKGVEYPQEYI